MNRETRAKICNVLRVIPDKPYLSIMYYVHMHKRMNWNNPTTFNEKMQWLKLYYQHPDQVRMVDKYEAKKYVADRIGEKYIIPTIGVWDRFEDIDFDKLPDRFVLKCTHDSGGLVICTDKKALDYDDAKRKIKKSLATSYFLYGREMPYKHVRPRIIAEAYMEDSEGKGELSDYKIHCYNGDPKVIQLISERFEQGGMRNDHYTPDWEKLDLKRGHYAESKGAAKRPEELPELLELAATLSRGFPYLRTDFYIVNHQVYFGELTFFPASGFNPFTPESYDTLFGGWIQLPRG